MNCSPHVRHWWTDVLHSMTFRLMPVGVSSRSNAVLTLGAGVRPCFLTPLMTSLLLHAGQRDATIMNCLEALSLRLVYFFFLVLCFLRGLLVRI